MSETQSVLDGMTKSITDRKQTRGTKLTPVAGETPIEPPVGIPIGTTYYSANYPWDQPAPAVQQVIIALRMRLKDWTVRMDELYRRCTDDLAYLEEGLRELERVAGLQEGGPKPPSVFREDGPTAMSRRKESEADQWVKEYEAKCKEAQEQVFIDLDDGPEPETGTGGWVCPTHGAEHVEILKSRKGRVYGSCRYCGEFEK